ncbi:hypothetical protein [Idiomarina zobellii]|uniref:hypothetical protein n=1 Tax=Idiomarina zobellii TaxID=86103 RepID=UPI0006B5B42F|nr:hypothetical protein [Idiomarina zobellii]SDG33107.1 hypothetical protein SAMN04515658_1238 [Idiomarina zobellii]
MSRSDLSPHIVHFTKGKDHDSAFENLLNILREKTIFGASNCIKGDYRCVCFTEAPLWSVEDGLANPEAYRRYSPFGVMFDKDYIFDLGGRPVIYQSDYEFEKLPESHRWRHVRYQPSDSHPVDFTWEREWRLRATGLELNPSSCVVVIPDIGYAERLYSEYESEQDINMMQYSQVIGEELSRHYRNEFPWRIAVLSE